MQKNKDEKEKFVQQNEDLINLRRSKQYLSGKKRAKFLKLLRKGKFLTIVKKIFASRKIRKLSHPEYDNDFCEPAVDNDVSKIVIYTCITGGYDKLRDSFADGLDFVAFIDTKGVTSNCWKISKIPEKIKKLNDKALINRYIKFHPYELFGDKYDVAIYVDGNVSVVDDVRSLATVAKKCKTGLALHRHRQRDSLYNEAAVCRIIGKGNKEKISCQVDRYRKEGFPEEYGLFECSVIVTDLHNEKGKKILDDWWEEYLSSGSGRDQLAIPYVLWKNGYKFSDVGSLGKNVYRNPKFLIAEKTHEVGDEY